MRVSPLHLERDAVHLDEASHAVPVRNFGHDYERYVAEHCTPGAPGRLVTLAESQHDWKVWEMHPEGDEVVIVLRGRATFIQRLPDGDVTMEVGPHEAVINPAGFPHTANVIEPFLALYITPGPGTEHIPRDDRE
jgi:mannose-6-phosphate isomerase-like protein (cupin superfamily)